MIIHYNIHNHQLSQDEKSEVLRHLSVDLDYAQENPTRCIVIVGGDFNFACQPPRKEPDAEVVGASQAALREWRARQDKTLMRALNRMVEVEVPEPTHHYAPKRMLSYIDRQFVSLPGWLCVQMSLSGVVTDPPELLNHRGISDHAPVQVTLVPGGMVPVSERPVPPVVCDHPIFRKFLETIEAECDQSMLTPPAAPGVSHPDDA